MQIKSRESRVVKRVTIVTCMSNYSKTTAFNLIFFNTIHNKKTITSGGALVLSYRRTYIVLVSKLLDMRASPKGAGRDSCPPPLELDKK